MLSRLGLPVRRALRPCAFVLSLVCASSAYSQSAFTPLNGGWLGDGVVSLRSGSRERVRCKANYFVKPNDGLHVKLELRCASDAYKFELSGNLVQDGDTLLGDWFESTHRVGGRITGRINGGLIEARVEGDVVTALLTVETKGRHQSFVLNSPGAQAEQVLLELHR